MLIQSKPEYKSLVQAIMASKQCDADVATAYLDDAVMNVEQGDASYASAAMGLGLRVNLFGHCGFDAADYLASIV